MSDRLLFSLDKKTTFLHTAVDDLESFIWVLVWSLVHILKWAAEITDEILNNSSDSTFPLQPTHSRHSLQGRHCNGLLDYWPDRVFKGLLVTWLQIARKSRKKVAQLTAKLLKFEDSESSDNSDPTDIERVLDDIDEYCRGVYKEYLQAGFKYLRAIRGVFGLGCSCESQ
jgi:hypothetical protein